MMWMNEMLCCAAQHLFHKSKYLEMEGFPTISIYVQTSHISERIKMKIRKEYLIREPFKITELFNDNSNCIYRKRH